MARRGMTGQLNMFDLLHSMEEAPGEVEMVSLVPDFDEVPEVEKAPEFEEVPEVVQEESKVEEISEVVEEETEVEEIQESEDVVMSRTYVVNHEKIEIAYINYNKVRITIDDKTPILKEFASSKEAVDYYVEQIQEYEIDE